MTPPEPPVTNAPIALRIHDGGQSLPEDAEPIVAAWLRANRINPGQVSIHHPVSVLTVPASGGDFLMQVVVFHQYYIGPDGERELNFLTGEAVAFQRTVPMTVAYPQTPPAEQPPATQATTSDTANQGHAPDTPEDPEQPPSGSDGEGEADR